MKIEKINSNKIKIMFDSIELKENNISVHSFLSNSPDTQKLFLAILDIADEEFGFDVKNCSISYETISFNNKDFLIIITKSINHSKHNNISAYNLLEIYNHQNNNLEFESNNTSLSCPIYNLKNDTKILLYEFNDMEDLYSFCNYLKIFLPNKIFKNSLYQYDNKYFLEINLENLNILDTKKITSIISEYKNHLILSELTFIKLKECANLIIKNNAIQLLKA